LKEKKEKEESEKEGKKILESELKGLRSQINALSSHHQSPEDLMAELQKKLDERFEKVSRAMALQKDDCKFELDLLKRDIGQQVQILKQALLSHPMDLMPLPTFRPQPGQRNNTISQIGPSSLFLLIIFIIS